MKKIFILAAAVAVMASCAKTDNIDVVNATADNAIGFGAYTSTSVTKGEVKEKADVFGGGFGVFAFYQPETSGNFNSKKYATPDFMYNQKVTASKTGNRAMSPAERYAINSQLTGAKKEGDLKTAEILYDADDEADINIANAALPGALTINDVNPGTGKKFADDEAVNAYNATLPGAIHEGDVKTPATYYTWEEAEDWNEDDANASEITGTVLKAGAKVAEYDGNNCTYSPVKYWPNNALDKLSFFAYAPWDEDTAWDDINIKTDAAATKLTASFSISDEVQTQEDLLWAIPQINKTNKPTGANDLSNKIQFEFEHVTAKVDLHIGVAQVAKTADGPTDWKDNATKIKIKSIVFNDLYDGFDLLYNIDDETGVLTAATPASSNDNAQKFSLTVKPCNAAATISNGWTAGYHKYLEANQFMFLAPQEFNTETVTVTYVVETTADDAANSSTITNVITKDIKDIFPALVAGNAYNINFLIGMDDVNIAATVVDWVGATDKKIEIPANE